MRARRYRVLLVVVALVGILTAPAVAQAVPQYSSQWATPGSPYLIAVNGYGDIFVPDYSNGVVRRYDGDGAVEDQWDTGGAGSGPMGVAVSRTGLVAVSTLADDKVTVYRSNGDFAFLVGTGTAGSGHGQFNDPNGVAFDRFGFIYVVDYGNHRIQKFYPDGRYLTEWGGVLGSGPGEFSSEIYDVAVDALGYVYVTDWMNNRVQKFTSDGAYVLQFGVTGTDPGKMLGPSGIEVGQDGNVYVAESDGFRVQAFTPDGAYLFGFGESGAGDGQFQRAWGIGSDGSGIYVSDYQRFRVQKFTLASSKRATRVGGADRYDVAVNLVATRWPNLKGIKHVIVVCGENRANADPLAASGLAGIYDAPILMTKTSGLTGSTSNMLKAIRSASGPITIHVVGGTTSIPKTVYKNIAATNPGGGIERINGKDRYELSANVAIRVAQVANSKGIPVPGVLLFNGQNSRAFYDALAAGPLSAGGQAPMMALRNDSVPPPVRTALNSTFAGKPRWVVSSTAYVPAAVYNAAGASQRFTTSTDRARAALEIADWGGALGLTQMKHVGIANKLPDALTGGSFLGEQGGILLYTDLNSLPYDTTLIGNAAHVASWNGWAFGGTSSVSDAALSQFNTVLNTP